METNQLVLDFKVLKEKPEQWFSESPGSCYKLSYLALPGSRPSDGGYGQDTCILIEHSPEFLCRGKC